MGGWIWISNLWQKELSGASGPMLSRAGLNGTQNTKRIKPNFHLQTKNLQDTITMIDNNSLLPITQQLTTHFTMPQMMPLTSNSIPDASIRRGPGENTPTIATTTQYFRQSTISLSHHTIRPF